MPRKLPTPAQLRRRRQKLTDHRRTLAYIGSILGVPINTLSRWERTPKRSLSEYKLRAMEAAVVQAEKEEEEIRCE